MPSLHSASIDHLKARCPTGFYIMLNELGFGNECHEPAISQVKRTLAGKGEQVAWHSGVLLCLALVEFRALNQVHEYMVIVGLQADKPLDHLRLFGFPDNEFIKLPVLNGRFLLPIEPAIRLLSRWDRANETPVYPWKTNRLTPRFQWSA